MQAQKNLSTKQDQTRESEPALTRVSYCALVCVNCRKDILRIKVQLGESSRLRGNRGVKGSGETAGPLALPVGGSLLEECRAWPQAGGERPAQLPADQV